jgi:hypothetical protein
MGRACAPVEFNAATIVTLVRLGLLPAQAESYSRAEIGHALTRFVADQVKRYASG